MIGREVGYEIRIEIEDERLVYYFEQKINYIMRMILEKIQL